MECCGSSTVWPCNARQLHVVEFANISLHKKLKEDDLQASNFLCLLLLYSSEENLNLPICLIRLVMCFFSTSLKGGTVFFESISKLLSL